MIRGLVRVWSGLDTNAAMEVAWAGSAPDRGTTETSCRLERLHLGCREQKGGRLVLRRSVACFPFISGRQVAAPQLRVLLLALRISTFSLVASGSWADKPCPPEVRCQKKEAARREERSRKALKLKWMPKEAVSEAKQLEMQRNAQGNRPGGQTCEERERADWDKEKGGRIERAMVNARAAP
ncbi:hypothetical protein NDU88_004730 [Pleurodeles waltl]|uniref:Uncharacterized protein n=1 Tax=Pleurodeles waltl TaxID=8319 RepID=A0AAV7L1S9_PLEWA|nr:hypothetical protein NDU88_004730 [Pleurodeles waltl]